MTFGFRNNGGGNALAVKKQPTEEDEETAKQKYSEIFAPDDTYEVRLRNKALAMKKGRLIGMAVHNSFAVFESKKMFVAVPAETLNKKLQKNVAEQLEAAKELYVETGVAFDDVHEVPESGEQKTVGLGNRERITMFFHRKEQGDGKKKSQTEKATKDAAAKSKVTANQDNG
jgi:hypothetical protein